MPLQLRRGTTAARQSMTPEISELIYDTEQKLVYVGDGDTPGGVAIDQDSSPNLALSDLNNVVIDGLSVGEIIKYNGTNWVNDALAVTDLSDVEFTNIQTNQLLKWNGTAWVNDVISPTDLPGNFVGDVTGSVFADDSTMMIDATEGRIVGPVFANVTGNVSGNLIGNVTGDLLGDVTGDLLGNVTGNVAGNLVNTLNEIIVNASTKAATLAELNIEAFGSINSTSMLISSPSVSFINGTVDPTQPFVNFFVSSSASSATSSVGLVRSRGTLISPTSIEASDEIGSIVASAFDGSTFILTADMTSVVDGTVSTGVVPSRIDFNATDATGTRSIKMSIKASAVEFTAPPRLPVIADDTARTAAVPAPAKGMMIIMEAGAVPAATNIVQVYDGSAWVNLH